MTDRTENTIHDDINELRTMLPAPDVASMHETALVRVEHELLARIAESRHASGLVLPTTSAVRPRRLVRVAALVAVGAAALILLPGLLRPAEPGGGRAGLSAGAAPAAARVLDQAADAALRANITAPRDDQWVYVRSVWTVGHPEPGDRPRTDREIWLSQRATMRDGSTRYSENGNRVPIWFTSDHGEVPAGITRPTYLWLDSLPTDPDELDRRLRHDIEGAGLSEPAGDDDVFTAIGDLISENLVPPRIEAALYQLVTRLPGVVSTAPMMWSTRPVATASGSPCAAATRPSATSTLGFSIARPMAIWGRAAQAWQRAQRSRRWSPEMRRLFWNGPLSTSAGSNHPGSSVIDEGWDVQGVQQRPDPQPTW